MVRDNAFVIFGVILLALAGVPSAVAADADQQGSKQDECDERSDLDCLYYGQALVSQRELDRANIIFEALCSRRYAWGCAELAFSHLHGRGFTQDVDRGLAILEENCPRHDAIACTYLAMAYDEAVDLEQDIDEAVRLYRLACRLDEPFACNNLGSLTLEGRGVEQDISAGIGYLQRSCDLEFGFACVNLAEEQIYRPELGVSSEVVAQNYRLGCEFGNHLGCAALGFLYMIGDGVPEDAAEARRLLRIGCEGEVPESCMELGELVRDGLGGPSDTTEAADLFSRACTVEVPEACEAEERLSQAVRD